MKRIVWAAALMMAVSVSGVPVLFRTSASSDEDPAAAGRKGS
jgi:hypothetical protein